MSVSGTVVDPRAGVGVDDSVAGVDDVLVAVTVGVTQRLVEAGEEVGARGGRVAVAVEAGVGADRRRVDAAGVSQGGATTPLQGLVRLSPKAVVITFSGPEKQVMLLAAAGADGFWRTEIEVTPTSPRSANGWGAWKALLRSLVSK